MDWNNVNAGYVIASYAISGVSLLGLAMWCILRDRSARKILKKQNAE